MTTLRISLRPSVCPRPVSISPTSISERKLGALARICALLLLLGAVCMPARAQSSDWTQESPQTSPSARSELRMAYDAAHGQVVMFGGVGVSNGVGNGFLNDTWTWDGINWTQRSPATVPPARDLSGMAYDAAHGQVVMFGGLASNNGFLNDTWTWNGSNWTQQNPTTVPPGRADYGMAYDSVHGQVVMFGGLGSNNANGLLDDTWTWDGSNWTQQSPATVPPMRYGHSMAYDSAHGQVVMFGGLGKLVLGDTWTWDGSNWTQQSPATVPSTRDFYCMSYDSAHGQVDVFGGLVNEVAVNETWTWDGTNWTQQNPTTMPPVRDECGLAYDSAHGQVVMFGGLDNNEGIEKFLNDTWTYYQAVPITVATSPSGLLVSVDNGANQAAPLNFTWAAGSMHTIAAVSPQGTMGTRYVFSSWSDGGALSHMVSVPTVTTSYTANLSTSYLLTAAVNTSAGGSVAPNVSSPTGDGYYPAETALTLTATPKAGYIFSNWSGTTSSSANPLMVTMNGPVSETANFTNQVPVTIATSPSGLLASVDQGASQAAPLNLSWQIGSQHTITTVSPQGTGTRYLFSSWSDGGAISHTVMVPANAVTYTASFTPQYELTTIVSPSGAGTVSPASGNYYSPGTVVNLNTSPYNGYVFQNWGGTVANPNATSTTVTMSAPETVTANYTEFPTQLAGSVKSRSGPNNARVWTFLIENAGFGAANAAQLNTLTLTQTLGPVCTPQVTTALPLVIGNMTPVSYAYASVTINFGGCSALARFSLNATLSANQGRATGVISETGQAP